ncbi:EAL and GGDEF domain-containing protein [Rhodocyclus tenuis]|uniref:sensor domain-containing protein n=1 Tax=Rhodocyclus tenuis TaxID=1066 RepID=UPI001903E626|nr:bifunctional diguanylate cyclase/phosphodiesterase [Rhodocyclus tenuis]MBK1679515.1 hypothetical protein [Rhodocyclus tenuis]
MSSLQLRAAAEERFAGSTQKESLDFAADELMYELQMRRIELELQNESLRELQHELEESRNRYRDLYEFAPVGYLTLSEAGLIVDINLKGESLLGRTRSRLLQHAFARFVAPTDTGRWHTYFNELLHTDERLECELALRRKADSPVFVRVDSLRLEQHGRPTVLRVVMTDISERKRAELAREKSELFVRTIANSIPGLVAYWTSALRCTFANDGYLSWFGRSKEQMIGVHMADLLGAELFRKNEAYIEAALRGEDQQFERMLVKTNGETRCAWAQYIPHVVDGEVLGFFVLVTDITAVKRDQEQLRVSDVALKAVSQGVIITGADRLIVTVNDAFLSITGYAAAEVFGQSCRFLQGPLTSEQTVTAIRLALQNGEKFSGEILNYRKDGSAFWNDLSISPVFDEHGKLTHFIGITRDVTERKIAADELLIAAAAFASQNGMVITDPNGVILRVNPAFTRLTGYSPEEVIGKTMSILNSGRQDREFFQRMWGQLREKGFWKGEIWNRRKNGHIYAELLAITAVTTPDRGTTHFVGSFSDITDDREAVAEIHRLAYYDALTRLPNRRLLQDRLAQAVAATARSGHCGAICFIDLDNFKALNDTRGHDVGDLLLVEVAQRLRATVRESDTVARQGGDEFVVLLEDLGADSAEAVVQARLLAEKLRESIGRPFLLQGYEYHCGISIGVGMFHERDTAENLFKHADLALYHAKRLGRNTLCFFDPSMQAALDLRSTLETELRQALKGGQLCLFFQPQVDVTRRVIGVEALLRWQHPQRGLVPPGDFIPLAEENGLILPIGLWVLDSACSLLKEWEMDVLLRDLPIAVNVSARQFRQPDFVAQVQHILETHAANAGRLKLELTESLVLEDVEDSIAKMASIKALGVRFAMDDFGTGYSSLSYLATLPLDQLKIDQSFVRNLPGKKNDETIARTIITMAQGLEMEVIAEGVETEVQRAFLEAHGCMSYQGYLFSQPLPLEALYGFLRRANAVVPD